MVISDLTTDVERMRSVSDGTEVVISVAGPKKTPDATRSLRARARAIAAAGVMPTALESAKNLTAGEIKRFTVEKGDPSRDETGRITADTTHTIIVNRD